MFSIFKKKEDIWSNDTKEDNKQAEEDQVEYNEIGLVIHFTPSVTYIYIVEDGQVWGDSEGTFSLMDEDSNYIIISGTIISTSVNNIKDVEDKLKELKIEGNVLRFNVSGN